MNNITTMKEENLGEKLVSLSIIAEVKNSFTVSHINRVSELVKKISVLFRLPDAETIAMASKCHDIGKIGIRKEVLQKPGKLSVEEFEEVKQHTFLGAEIVKSFSPFTQKDYSLFNYIKEIALLHHEKCDGSGYPFGLTCDEIPLHVKIVTVVDVFDALISLRPYKRPWSPEEAITYLVDTKQKYDKDVMKALIECIK